MAEVLQREKSTSTRPELAPSSCRALCAINAPSAMCCTCGGTAAMSGFHSAGLLREIQLVLKVRFRLHAQGGKDLLAATELMQTRDLTFNETNALAKEGEADLLFRDMQIDIAQQLVRRLGAVKTL